MVLDPSLYKVLVWSFMGLIRSELYCLGIRIQKKFLLPFQVENKLYKASELYHLKANGAKLSGFVIYIEAIIYLLW